MTKLLCLTKLTIVYRFLRETMSSLTYDKCHYFVVKASGLVDVEETKFNHRRTKYYYVRNPNVVKKVKSFTLKIIRRENEICTLSVSCVKRFSRVQIKFLTTVHYSKTFNILSYDFELVYNVQYSA